MKAGNRIIIHMIIVYTCETCKSVIFTRTIKLDDNSLARGFKICHINARSIKSKIEEIALILHELKLEVLTISETWLSQGVESTCLSIPNYNLYRQDRVARGKKGGGLAIYVRKDYKTDDKIYSPLNISIPDIEAQTIKISKVNHKSTVIINAYRPPSGNQTAFLEHIVNIVGKVGEERYADTFLLGDMNLDHTIRKKNELTINLENTLKSLGLKQQITKPTRVTTSNKSLIDVIYVKSSKKLMPFICESSLSDHFLVGCVRHLSYTQPAKITYEARSYKNYSIEAAREYYSTFDTSPIYDMNDVNLIWGFLLSIIQKCATKLCPYKTISTRAEKAPWMSSELLHSINDRDKAFLEAYESSDPNKIIEAKKKRTATKKAVRNARAAFIQEQIAQNQGNPRKMWQDINKLIKSPESDNNIELVDENKCPIPESLVSGHINSYFATIGPKLAEKFSEHVQIPEHELDIGNHDTNPLFYLNTVTSTALMEQIKQIDTQKSSGIKGINSRLIKDAMGIMLTEFTYLMNSSISSGSVPEQWKIGTVIPIPKVKNSSNVSDLRPISLLPLPSKILEKFIHADLMNYLTDYHLLNDAQFGFRPGLSTSDAIATLLDDIGLNINNGNLTIITYIRL